MNEPIVAGTSPPKKSFAANTKAPAQIDAPTTAIINAEVAFQRTQSSMDLKTLRVAEYAACQMLLDALYSATSGSNRDLESVWIVTCVMHNTLRNLVTDPHVSARYLGQEEVPDHIFMTMSRRAIADKTGLSRETVRRRTNKLIDDGVLIEVNGNVRLADTSPRRRVDIASVNQMHAAAVSFLKRLQEHNAQLPLDLPER